MNYENCGKQGGKGKGKDNPFRGRLLPKDGEKKKGGACIQGEKLFSLYRKGYHGACGSGSSQRKGREGG